MRKDSREDQISVIVALILLVPLASWGQIAFTFLTKDEGEGICTTDPSGSYVDHFHIQRYYKGNFRRSVDVSPYSLDLVYSNSFWEMGANYYEVWVKRKADGERLGVLPSSFPDPISDITWSPSGDRLVAIADGDQIISIMDGEDYWEIPKDSRVRRRVDAGTPVTHVDWAPAERFVVSSEESEDIWITDGVRSQFLSRGIFPKVSLNGENIAFVVPGKSFREYEGFPDAMILEHENSVWIMNLDGSSKKLIHQWEFGSSGVAWSPDSREIIFADGVGMYESSIKTVSLDGTTKTILDVEVRVVEIEWAAPWGLPTGVSPVSWGELKREHEQVR